MPAIKNCPRCDRPPADCECPPGDRWIHFDRLLLRLGAGFVDLRVSDQTTRKDIEAAIPTARAWAKRLSADRPFNLRAQIRRAYRGGSEASAVAWWLGQRKGLTGRKLESFAQRAARDGLKPAQIAEWLNARLEGYAEKKGVWIQAGVFDLMAIDQTMTADAARDVMLEGVFLRNYPVSSLSLRNGPLRER